MSAGGVVKFSGVLKAAIDIWLSPVEVRLNSRIRARAEAAGAEDGIVVERMFSMSSWVVGGRGHTMKGQLNSPDLPREKE